MQEGTIYSGSLFRHKAWCLSNKGFGNWATATVSSSKDKVKLVCEWQGDPFFSIFYRARHFREINGKDGTLDLVCVYDYVLTLDTYCILQI